MNIGVFFGSGSPEHDISIITAQLVISELKKLGYQVTPVYITKQRQWMIGDELGSLKIFSDPSQNVSEQKNFAEYYLDLENSVGKIVFKKKGLTGKSITVDLAFPTLHGSYGEDGTIQGMFEMLGIPYVGCDVTASAIAMDKVLTKQIAQVHDVPTAKYLYFHKHEWDGQKGEILQKVKDTLSWPVFVKPVHLGSSIAIGKVKNQDLKDLEYRIEVALHYDNKVLVEESVENAMDVTCCVLGNENLRPSLLQESVFSTDLFDFEEKYLKEGGAQLGEAQKSLVIPARLPDDVTKAIQEAAKKVYTALGCSGIARVDFLVDRQTNNFYVSEVNPLPGTLYHHLWKASGMEISEVLKELIHLAEQKHEQNKNLSVTFESSVLKQLNSKKLGSKL